MLLILAATWMAGGAALVVLALDRSQAEPWVRAILPTLLSMMASRPYARIQFHYSTYDYLGLEVAIGLAVLITTAIIGYMLLPKPAQNRRIDAYLAARRQDR